MNLKNSKIVHVTLLALSLGGIAAAQQSLGPGSPAPKLEIKRWLKGEPIKGFEKGKTYVIDFWASWCPNCLISIPHLTELAQKNPDVVFLGAGIWEEDGRQLKAFMSRMGDQMGYRIGYSGNKDAGMGPTWMRPAVQRGIPTAFIVKDRKIMWIGHPDDLDKPLDEIKQGTFDLAAFKKTFDATLEEERRMMAIEDGYDAALKLWRDGKREEAKKALGAFVEKHPDYAQAEERVRFGWLAEEDREAWLAKTREMLATGDPAVMQKIATFAAIRANEPGGEEIALTTIGMVLEADKKEDVGLISSGLGVYMKLGEYKPALVLVNRIIERLHNDPPKDYPFKLEPMLKTKAYLEAKLAGK